MRNNRGRPMSIYDIPLIVKQALPMAATMSNIRSGFKVSGIWPYNPDIFTDEEFLPSYITDRPQFKVLPLHNYKTFKQFNHVIIMYHQNK